MSVGGSSPRLAPRGWGWTQRWAVYTEAHEGRLDVWTATRLASIVALGGHDFQHAAAASTRFIQTVDEMLQDLLAGL